MSTSTLETPKAGSDMTLIDRLLAEQRELTAVERFSQHHDRATGPVQRKYYQNLIPLTKPGRDEQYAFEVDMDKCTGCKACVSACHSLNGLEENETWRDIGTIVGGVEGTVYQQTITTACHHCADPGCANGCPVLAYEKDEETGIVRHLDDQCIGCQYCSLKCPYDVPKYSKAKGIVRKCDMCHSRLAVGEAPACVQACPTAAIRIVKVTTDEVAVRTLPGKRLVPGAFRSSYTKPTTRYVTKRTIPADTRAATAFRPHREHSHLPLVNMLSLTQMSVGLLVAQAAIPHFTAHIPLGFLITHLSAVNILALVLLHVGLVASILHLGQPLKAWRVFLGLRKSWLSREVVAFGMLPPLAIGAVFLPLLAWPAALAGLACVLTSVMVYADTQRELWKFPRTTLRFYGTVALFAGLGLAILGNPFGFVVASVAAILKLTAEARLLRAAARNDSSPDSLSAQILWNPSDGMRRLTRTRWITMIAGVGLLPFGGTAALAVAGALLAISEWIERYQFFTAVVAHRMPR